VEKMVRKAAKMFNQFCDEQTRATILDALKSSVNIAIAGHVHPDGDAVGSCLGLARFIQIVNPAAKVAVYLGEASKDFSFLAGFDKTTYDFDKDIRYDLFLSLDCSDIDRLGPTVKYFESADFTICIDHHITNEGFADINVISSEASSTSELVASIIELEYADRELAECLYLGIVHDTGVFKHSCTSESTMDYAGKLIDLGARCDYVIDQTFFKMTFAQNKALGRVMDKAELFCDGKLIISTFEEADEQRYGVFPANLGCMIDKLRVTEDVKIAAFIYWQNVDKEWSVSLRANDDADVSAIAMTYGGGGHVKAAGYKSKKSLDEIIEEVKAAAAKQLM